MNLCQVLKSIVEESGKSHRELASSLGKSGAYVSVTVTNACSGKDIGVSKLVSIADECGFDVEVVSRRTGERVRLDS